MDEKQLTFKLKMPFSNLSSVMYAGSNNRYTFITSPTRLVIMILAFFILKLVTVDNNNHFKNDKVKD